MKDVRFPTQDSAESWISSNCDKCIHKDCMTHHRFEVAIAGLGQGQITKEDMTMCASEVCTKLESENK